MWLPVKKEWGHKGVKRQHHDASSVSAASRDKVTLISKEMKSRSKKDEKNKIKPDHIVL